MNEQIRVALLLAACLPAAVATAAEPPMPALRWPLGPDQSLTRHLVVAASTDPNKKQGVPGCLAVEIWQDQSERTIASSYPEELPWNMPTKPVFAVQPLDRLSGPRGLAAARLRCLLNVPHDGYYQLSAEAAGFQLILLSDDATPDRLRPLWRDGALWEDYGPGFKDHRLRLDSPWTYFKRDEPRYLEIRHLHTPGRAFISLAWTAQDGVRRAIPAECVTSYLPPETAAPMPPPDGGYHGLLPEGDVSQGRLDLRTARAVTSGWAEVGPESSDWEGGVTNNKRKLPDFGLCTTFGGSLEIPFTTTTAGYQALVLDAQLCGGKPFGHFEICREIDGIRFGRELLAGVSNDATTFRTLTPWLEQGAHSLRLHCVPDRNVESLRILALALQPVADDAAQSAVRARLSRENAFLPGRGDGGSLISPACVEMAARVSAAPVFKAGGRAIAVREATPGVWWADVLLPESGEPVALSCASAADRTESAATAHWAETRVHEHPEIHLRVGDALRLTAWQDAAGANATATISARGKDSSTPAGKPLVLRFDQPGDETITAVFTPQSGEAVRTNLIVHILPRLAAGMKTEWTRTDRVSPLQPLPAGAWPDGGTGATFRAAPAGGWLSAPRLAGEWPAVVRAGPAGPVLGAIQVRGIDLTYELRTYSTEEKYSVGIFQELAAYFAIVRGLPPGWKVSFDQSPIASRPWDVLRPDQAKPFRQEVYPWRYGACAVGEFWFKRTGKPGTWLAGDFGVVPPAE